MNEQILVGMVLVIGGLIGFISALIGGVIFEFVKILYAGIFSWGMFTVGALAIFQDK